jgi:hypothetical protein
MMWYAISQKRLFTVRGIQQLNMNTGTIGVLSEWVRMCMSIVLPRVLCHAVAIPQAITNTHIKDMTGLSLNRVNTYITKELPGSCLTSAELLLRICYTTGGLSICVSTFT